MSARTAIINAVGDTYSEMPIREVMRGSDAILSALRSAGWAVVPVEPTEGMLKAGHGWSSGVPTLDRCAWLAMLKAAQEDSREW